MLSTVVQNNANRSRVSLRSTFSNCHFLFGYLIVLYTHRCNRLIWRETSIHATLNWAVRVINKHRLRPTLLMTPHIPPSAHRRRCGLPWRVDKNSRRQGVWAGDFSVDRNAQFLPNPPALFWRPHWDYPIGISSRSFACFLSLFSFCLEYLGYCAAVFACALVQPF